MSEKRIDVVVRTGSSKQTVDALDKSMTNLGRSADKTADSIQDTALATKNLKPTAAGVNKALGGVGRSAGQAGIQIQQFVGQVQGGQSAMLALSQQGADLGFVLGAPLLGAIVGIGASAIGMAMAFYETGESTEELIEKIRELKGETNLTAEQQAFLDRENEKSNVEKRKRIGALKEEIAELSTELEYNEQISKGIFEGEIQATNANRARAQSVGELREELVKLRAEQSTLEQELSPVKDTKQVDSINAQIKKEREIYEAARFQRLRTEAGFQTAEIQQINISTANRTLALQNRFEEQFEILRANGQSTEELERLHQDNLALIVQEGEDRKLAIKERADMMANQKLQQAAKLTQQSYQQSGQLVLSTLMELAGGSEKAAKAIKIAQGGMAAYMVYSNHQAAAAAMLAPPPLGLGPIAGAGPAAAIAAAGKVQAGLTLAAATASAFSGSSVSAPNVANPSESLISQGATGQPQVQPTTTRTVDVRLADDALLTGSTVKEILGNILSNDEDTVIEITAQQNNLRRTGAI